MFVLCHLFWWHHCLNLWMCYMFDLVLWFGSMGPFTVSHLKNKKNYTCYFNIFKVNHYTHVILLDYFGFMLLTLFLVSSVIIWDFTFNLCWVCDLDIWVSFFLVTDLLFYFFLSQSPGPFGHFNMPFFYTDFLLNF